MLVYIQTTIAIIIGIIATVTDIRNKKIYNKVIIIVLAISAFSYIFLFREIEYNFIINYIVNFFIALLISFIFYYFKIWSAGDAKLFIAIIFMIPYSLYESNLANIFPGLYVLIIIFSIAFIYIIIETIYLWCKDKYKFEKLKFSKIKKEEISLIIIQYFTGYFIVIFINNILFTYFQEFKSYNQPLILLCNMLFLVFIYRVIKTKKSLSICCSIFLLSNIVYYSLVGFNIIDINLKMLLIVLLILIFRRVSEKYNYEEIEVKDLKPRMILSYGTIFKFYASKVKGLPKTTTESTDSRITEEEVDSIQRWSKTSKGEKTIVIVRHMAFAPFILIGELVFFIFKLYM